MTQIKQHNFVMEQGVPCSFHVYDVFIYDANNKPKAKILKGHILVKGSVSDRGRVHG